MRRQVDNSCYMRRHINDPVNCQIVSRLVCIFVAGWLMVVQAFVTLGLILSFTAQIIIALELVRWPLRFVLKYEYLLSGIAFVCNATCGNLVLVFVSKHITHILTLLTC